MHWKSGLKQKMKKLLNQIFTPNIFWPQLCYSPTWSHLPKPNMIYLLFPKPSCLSKLCQRLLLQLFQFGLFFLLVYMQSFLQILASASYLKPFLTSPVLDGHSSPRIPEELLFETSIWHLDHATWYYYLLLHLNVLFLEQNHELLEGIERVFYASL